MSADMGFDRQIFLSVTANMVGAEFPLEVAAFEVSSNIILDKLSGGQPIERADIAPMEFGVSVSEALHFVQIIISVYFTVKRLIDEFKDSKKINKRELEFVMTVFGDELKANGFTSERAIEISHRYASEIVKIVK